MNKEVYDKLYTLAKEDYEKYVSEFARLEKENPDLEFEEIDDLIEHKPIDIPADLQGYPEEYEAACLMVYAVASINALMEDV